MSRFYASIQGNKGEATRQGSKLSGIEGHIRGWHVGARVLVQAEPDGEDVVFISLTGGSNDPGQTQFIGSFIKEGNGFKKL